MRGEGLAVANSNKTACYKGHAFVPENTKMVYADGAYYRRCVTCERMRTQKRDKARHAATVRRYRLRKRQSRLQEAA